MYSRGERYKAGDWFVILRRRFDQSEHSVPIPEARSRGRVAVERFDEGFGHAVDPGAFAPRLGRVPTAGFRLQAAARAATVPQILGSTQHSLECLSARFLVTTTVEKLSKIGDAIARAQDFTDLYCDLARTFAGAEATPLNQPEDADNPSLTPAADRQLGHQVSAQRRAPERHNGLVFPLAARLPDF
jgi:hypothetical protein